tara:strand:- start:714 stop:1025 length:312 start_codon:yes stop_codon:yes gene_type:complete
MKVKIQNRSVYHKFAEVEVEIDEDDFDHWKLDNGKYASIQDFLIENEDLYIDKIDDKMSKASYEFGFGTDSDANSHNNSSMNESDQESEWRYEIVGKNYGGHL